MRSVAAAIACVLALSGAASVLAQTPPAEKPVTKTKPAAQKPAQKAAPAQPQVVMPDAEKIVLLLRSTLITLNDAIQTGNFTVLRDMSAPGFRDANTAARLGQSFTDLASKGIDLSPTSVIAPQLTEPPGLDQKNAMLRLKGYSRVSRCRSISRCCIRRSMAAGDCSDCRCSRDRRRRRRRPRARPRPA